MDQQEAIQTVGGILKAGATPDEAKRWLETRTDYSPEQIDEVLKAANR